MFDYATTLFILAISKTDFLRVFSLISIYTWKGLRHFYLDYYTRFSYRCNNVSLSLFLLFLTIFYLGILIVKQCLCKLCFESGTDRLECICFYSYLSFTNFLLCELIMLEILSVREYLIFCVFPLNILYNLLNFGR